MITLHLAIILGMIYFFQLYKKVRLLNTSLRSGVRMLVIAGIIEVFSFVAAFISCSIDGGDGWCGIVVLPFWLIAGFVAGLGLLIFIVGIFHYRRRVDSMAFSSFKKLLRIKKWATVIVILLFAYAIYVDSADEIAYTMQEPGYCVLLPAEQARTRCEQIATIKLRYNSR